MLDVEFAKRFHSHPGMTTDDEARTLATMVIEAASELAAKDAEIERLKHRFEHFRKLVEEAHAKFHDLNIGFGARFNHPPEMDNNPAFQMQLVANARDDIIASLRTVVGKLVWALKEAVAINCYGKCNDPSCDSIGCRTIRGWREAIAAAEEAVKQ